MRPDGRHMCTSHSALKFAAVARARADEPSVVGGVQACGRALGPSTWPVAPRPPSNRVPSRLSRSRRRTPVIPIPAYFPRRPWAQARGNPSSVDISTRAQLSEHSCYFSATRLSTVASRYVKYGLNVVQLCARQTRQRPLSCVLWPTLAHKDAPFCTE